MPGQYLPPVVGVLTGDWEDLKAKLREVNDSLDELGAKHEEPEVGVAHVEETKAELDDLKASLDEYGAKREDASVGISDQSLARSFEEIGMLDAEGHHWDESRFEADLGISQTDFARTQAELEATKLRVDELTASEMLLRSEQVGLLADLEKAAAAGGGGGGGAGGAAKKKGGGMPGWLTAGPGPGFLTLGALLGPGLLGAVQGLAVGAGGLATEFGIAAANAGAFGLIAYPAMEQVLKATKPLKGELGVLQKDVEGFKKSYDALAASVQPAVISDLAWAMGDVEQVLTGLKPLVVESTQSFKDFFKPIFDSMTGANAGNFKSFIDYLANEGAPAAHSFGVAFANVGISVANWMQDFAPALGPVEKGLDAVTLSWSKFSQGLANSPGWDNFLSTGVKDLGALGNVLGLVGRGLGGIFIAIGPSGPKALENVAGALRAIGAVAGPLIAPLAELGTAITTDLADFLAGLTGAKAGDAQMMTRKLGADITILARDTAIAGPEFRNLGTAIGKLLGAVSPILSPLGIMLTDLEGLANLKTFPETMLAIEKSLSPVAKALAGVAHWAESAWSWMGRLIGDIPGLKGLEAVLGGAGTILSHLPHFAGGGQFSAGTMAIVGENGPEPVIFGASGTVFPNSSLGGAGGVNVTVGAPQIHINGSNLGPAQLQAAVRNALSQFSGQLVHELQGIAS